MLKAWLELARISNLPTAWTNVLAGWLLAGGQLQDQRLIWLLLGGSLLYSGGMILNDAADAAFDREHRRERPIPSGRVSARTAWVGGLSMLALGLAACVHFGGAGIWPTLALVAAILAYDLYHKPWAGSVMVMGSCRTLLYLVAGSAVMGGLTLNCGWPAGLLASSLAVGAYIVGLTIVARMESGGGGPKSGMMLVGKVLLYAPGFAAAAQMFRGGDMRILILLLGFAVLISMTSQMMKRGGAEIGRAVGWLLAGIALVDALAVARVSFGLACAFAACVPLLRLWQRKIAAT